MKTLVGALLVMLGLMFVAVEVDSLLDGTSKDAVLGFTMAGLFMAGGGFLLRGALMERFVAGSSLDAHRAEQEASRDTLILQIARANGGRVTAAEVAADTVLSYEMAREELDQLSRAGACRTVVSERGVVVYHFPEFEDRASKDGSFM